MDRVPRKFKFPFDLKKVALVIAIVVLFFLVMDLNTRLNELSRLTDQRDKAATVVSQLQNTLDVLDTQVAFATSEGAVEQWAYGEGHMARPGEQLIVPLSPPGTTPIPVFIPTPTIMPVQNWEVWKALILGN